MSGDHTRHRAWVDEKSRAHRSPVQKTRSIWTAEKQAKRVGQVDANVLTGSVQVKTFHTTSTMCLSTPDGCYRPDCKDALGITLISRICCDTGPCDRPSENDYTRSVCQLRRLLGAHETVLGASPGPHGRLGARNDCKVTFHRSSPCSR